MEKLEKLAGVWLDNQDAYVVSNHNGREVTSLEMKGHVKNEGVGRYGSEVTANNSKVTSQHKFFNEIMSHLTNSQELYLIGPGTAQEELTHYLATIPEWKKMKVSDEPTDKMNAEQALNKISEHYSNRV